MNVEKKNFDGNFNICGKKDCCVQMKCFYYYLCNLGEICGNIL